MKLTTETITIEQAIMIKANNLKELKEYVLDYEIPQDKYSCALERFGQNISIIIVFNMTTRIYAYEFINVKTKDKVVKKITNKLLKYSRSY